MANAGSEINSNSNSNEYDWVQYYRHRHQHQEQQFSSDHQHQHHHQQQQFSSDHEGPMTRRRSRASKKTQTTLLNANTSNFRELVQQFTGCPTSATSIPVKGPVNLNFSLRNATPIIVGNETTHQVPQVSSSINNINNNHQLQQYYSSSTYPVNNTFDTIAFSDGFAMQDHDLSVNDIAITESGHSPYYSNSSNIVLCTQ